MEYHDVDCHSYLMCNWFNLRYQNKVMMSAAEIWKCQAFLRMPNLIIEKCKVSVQLEMNTEDWCLEWPLWFYAIFYRPTWNVDNKNKDCFCLYDSLVSLIPNNQIFSHPLGCAIFQLPKPASFVFWARNKDWPQGSFVKGQSSHRFLFMHRLLKSVRTSKTSQVQRVHSLVLQYSK